MRRLITAALSLAPALVTAAAYPSQWYKDGTPHALINLGSMIKPENALLRDINLQFRIFESTESCGYGNVTINGQALRQNDIGIGSGVITADYRTDIHASWKFTCIQLQDETERQLLTFAIHALGAQQIDNAAFSVQFQQTTPTSVSYVNGAEAHILIPEPARAQTPPSSDVAVTAPDLYTELGELESMRQQMLELQTSIDSKTKEISETFNLWRPDEKRCLSKWGSLQCLLSTTYGRVKGAARKLYGSHEEQNVFQSQLGKPPWSGSVDNPPLSSNRPLPTPSCHCEAVQPVDDQSPASRPPHPKGPPLSNHHSYNEQTPSWTSAPVEPKPAVQFDTSRAGPRPAYSGGHSDYHGASHSRPQNHVLDVLHILASVLASITILAFLVGALLRRCFFMAQASNQSPCEERRRERAARQQQELLEAWAARRAAVNAGYCAVVRWMRDSLSRQNAEDEEKEGVMRRLHESEGEEEDNISTTMEQEIAQFRAVAGVIGDMVAAEEGRVPEYRRSQEWPREMHQQHNRPRTPPSPTSAFPDYISVDESLPPYDECIGPPQFVVDGLRYSPGNVHSSFSDSTLSGSALDEHLERKS